MEVHYLILLVRFSPKERYTLREETMGIANNDEIPMFIIIDGEEDEIFFKDVDTFSPFFHFVIDVIEIEWIFLAIIE